MRLIEFAFTVFVQEGKVCARCGERSSGNGAL